MSDWQDTTIIDWAKNISDDLKDKTDEALKKVKKLEISNDVIKLNDVELPGCVESISIDGELLFDENEVSGQSGKNRSVKGWNDASISISVKLFNIKGDDGKITMSKYEMLEKMDQVFKKVENGKAVVYTIVNKHLKSRNVRTVYFKKLSSAESKSGISCNIEFIETDPKVNKKQQQTQKKKENEEAKKDEYVSTYIRGLNREDEKKVKALDRKLNTQNSRGA